MGQQIKMAESGQVEIFPPFLCPIDAHSTGFMCTFYNVCYIGGRLISLNKTSLEGVTFSAAAAILQNSPDEVELIVSQPKRIS